MKDVLILTKFAEDKIIEGDFLKANQALINAIKLDPHNISTFNLLGNVNYLLNKPNNSLKCYLACIHLKINKLKKMTTSTFSSILDIKYNKLSDEEKGLIPNKFGLAIFDDSTLSSHAAHAVIDLREEELDPILLECSNIYRQSIFTRNTPENIINVYNIDKNDYKELEETHYISLGREILIENIKWNFIDSNDVVNLYFS
ncbi:MAG: hypothetical protein ACRC7N_19335 [Clostridium sp.]